MCLDSFKKCNLPNRLQTYPLLFLITRKMVERQLKSFFFVSDLFKQQGTLDTALRHIGLALEAVVDTFGMVTGSTHLMPKKKSTRERAGEMIVVVRAVKVLTKIMCAHDCLTCACGSSTSARVDLICAHGFWQ